MDYLETAALVLIGLVMWFWMDALRSREAAIEAARAACESEQLQFLDDTVASTGLRLERDEDGRRRFRRVHTFEFSDSGNNRLKGSVVTIGRRVVTVNLGWRPSGNVWRIH